MQNSVMMIHNVHNVKMLSAAFDINKILQYFLFCFSLDVQNIFVNRMLFQVWLGGSFCKGGSVKLLDPEDQKVSF